MDKTYRSELFRLFLIEALPLPLTPASTHIQIFDNYITETRIRLRSVRLPETKEWSRTLQQRFSIVAAEGSVWKISQMHLDDAEYERFKSFEGNEIRKNRYFHEFDARMFAFDIYLGTLWGLNRARVDFDTEEELREFRPPPFAILEVTHEPFFDDGNLVYKRFEEVRDAVSNLEPLTEPRPEE
jgi:CYTH domain-containing protein